LAEETMTTDSEDQETSEGFEERLRLILPEQYQDSYDDVQPMSMGSAPLKYGPMARLRGAISGDRFATCPWREVPLTKAPFSNPAAEKR
jgi:hypothetical protein